MKNLILVSTLLLVWTNSVHCQTLLTKIEGGKVLIIEVKPIGDAWTDPSDEHTLKIYKTDSAYIIELVQYDISKKRIITKNQLVEVSQYITNWEEKRCKGLSCGLSYDMVKMKIGMKTNKFRTSQFSDADLIKKYFKE